MRRHYVDIDGKWAIVLAYDIAGCDLDEVGAWLKSLGASRETVRRSQDVLRRLNTGLTYSNDELRMSVMCIGHASSRAQWWDTLVHEIYHVQDRVLRYYGVMCGGEQAAWLQGYIMREIYRAVFW